MSDLYHGEGLAPDKEVRCSRFFTFIGGLCKTFLGQIVLLRQIVLRNCVRERGERENRKSERTRHSWRLRFGFVRGKESEFMKESERKRALLTQTAAPLKKCKNTPAIVVL